MAATGGSRLTHLGDTVAPTRKPNRIRTWSAGLAATLLLTVSSTALHADTSNAELAREIAELKAQIRAMKGSLSQTRAETRKMVRVARTPAPGYALPAPSGPAFPAGAIPVGATPAFVTADKKLQFGAITITPGGFLAAEGVYRSRTTNSDVGTTFGAIPFQNQLLSRADEGRLSARQSRVALLVEAPITPSFLASGYMELDFLAAAPTANSNQTNSYQPRIRNLYAALDESNYGMHVLAGQNWSLLTLNSKGITPRNEVTPAVIDANQVVGSVYARQAQIRLTKDFNKKLWVAVSVEESEQTFNPACGTPAANGGIGLTPAVPGANIPGVNTDLCGATGAGFNAPQVNYSLNRIPDIVGKVAYEARAFDRDIHLEVMGTYNNLYNRVLYNNGVSTNQSTNGFGVGGGIIAPIIPKRLDFQVNGLYGRGINRYGPAGLGEATFNQNGSLKPVLGAIALTGLTFHATPSIDVYGYAGFEQVFRSYFPGTGATIVGFGGPNTVDTGCYTQGAAAATCTGSTQREYELTAGFWDKLYKGSFGEVRVGANYAFVHRDIFNSPVSNAASGFNTRSPGINDHIVMTSFRYYPFQ